MGDDSYQQPRPSIPAPLRRAIEVESGHSCAISRCGEHTYLEVHHINGDREDNRLANLILLCDMHHKMAHHGVIDRKALREYKALLTRNYNQALADRVARLEALLAVMPKVQLNHQEARDNPGDRDLPTKQVTPRHTLMALTLEQLALAKYEKDHQLYFERQPLFARGDARLQLDAIRQDDSLPQDVIVEVRWIRKSYLDGPIWVQQVDAAASVYELISGRKAKGVLVLVVPKASMKELSALPYTNAALGASERKPDVVIYSYDDLGYDPGPISASLFASNFKNQE